MEHQQKHPRKAVRPKPEQSKFNHLFYGGRMMQNHRSGHSHILTSLAFGLAIFAGFAGVARCFVQSPQAQSDAYLQMSVNAVQNDMDLALYSAFEAARSNPASVRAWAHLAAMLQQSGDETTSRQAEIIAKRLQQNPNDDVPVYAMPAELRLGFLMQGGREF
jgi:hypothetical protein